MCSGDPLGIVGYGDQNGSHQPLFLFLCPVQYRHEGGPLLAASAYGFNPFGIIATPGTKARTGYGEIHAI
jgi:hypothetical protein